MRVLILLLLLLLNLRLSAQDCQIIKAKNAQRYVNKEVIVVGKLCSYGNSSYLQSAWLYLGPDTAHKQLKVLFQGENYNKGKTWIGKYIGKEVRIKGIVRRDNDVFLDATDSLQMK